MPSYKIYRRKKNTCSGKKVYIHDKSDYQVAKTKSNDPCVSDYYEECKNTCKPEPCCEPEPCCKEDKSESSKCCCGDKSESSKCSCEHSACGIPCMIVIDKDEHYDLSSYCGPENLTVVLDAIIGIETPKEILLPAPTPDNKCKVITILLAQSININNGVKIGFRSTDPYYFIGGMTITTIPTNYYCANKCTIITTGTTKKALHLVSSHIDYGGEPGTKIEITYIGDCHKVLINGTVFNSHHNPTSNKIFSTVGISYI